jgi:hypothetical protein
MKEYRNPPNVHEPITGYTHQIEISGSEHLLVLSGQVGKKEDGTVPDDLALCCWVGKSHLESRDRRLGKHRILKPAPDWRDPASIIATS